MRAAASIPHRSPEDRSPPALPLPPTSAWRSREKSTLVDRPLSEHLSPRPEWKETSQKDDQEELGRAHGPLDASRKNNGGQERTRPQAIHCASDVSPESPATGQMLEVWQKDKFATRPTKSESFLLAERQALHTPRARCCEGRSYPLARKSQMPGQQRWRRESGHWVK